LHTGSQNSIRCAVNTRKSADEGLEQEFNSLDAQRESAEAYIASQRHEGRVCIPDRFDDGGFTGGNMERPALKRLFAVIELGDTDCVVLYQVDRLSRSLLGFARIMELFDKHAVSFVSVTQQFNTTGSMGRLTLNILLSFARFEREIISERTRDKMSAARRKGKWVGGMPVLGYDAATPMRCSKQVASSPNRPWNVSQRANGGACTGSFSFSTIPRPGSCPSTGEGFDPGGSYLHRGVSVPVRTNGTVLPAWLYAVGDRWTGVFREPTGGIRR
jgi:DNA invertase Pin-like site-specific DNA recombinase